MSLFQRAHDIVAAKANKALDAAENPNEMLDYSYEQMLDHITQVRRALVDITASKKQLELQQQQLQHSVDHLQRPGQGGAGRGPRGPGAGGAVPQGGRPAADRRPGAAARPAHRTKSRRSSRP